MYIFGGLVNDRPSSDLFIMSCLPNSTSAINAYKETHPGATDLPQPGSLNIQWAGTVGEIPSPRLGHTSVGLGNVLIVWGGDTSTTPAANDMGDSTVANDDALYLLNLGSSFC